MIALEQLLTILRKIRAFFIHTILHRILIPVLLVFIYFVGVGLTSLVVRIFRPALLRPPQPLDDSFWIPASGYDPIEKKCLQQS